MAFTWEVIETKLPDGEDADILMYRAEVPGGWFIYLETAMTEYDSDSGSSTKKSQTNSFFYPDPEHQWDGKTPAKKLGW